MTSPNFQHSGFGLSPHPFFSDVNSPFSPGVHQNYEVSRKKKKKKKAVGLEKLIKNKAYAPLPKHFPRQLPGTEKWG